MFLISNSPFEFEQPQETVFPVFKALPLTITSLPHSQLHNHQEPLIDLFFGFGTYLITVNFPYLLPLISIVFFLVDISLL